MTKAELVQALAGYPDGALIVLNCQRTGGASPVEGIADGEYVARALSDPIADCDSGCFVDSADTDFGSEPTVPAVYLYGTVL